jgi:uncharacterized protein YjbJ (UPF0337 family)
MNWNDVARRWNEERSEIKSRWTKLTGDDLRTIDGDEKRLVAKIEERYGILEENALVEVNEWLEKRSPSVQTSPYRLAVLAAIMIGLVLAFFTFIPLPWGRVKYVAVASLSLVLMAILFRRRRRLEF